MKPLVGIVGIVYDLETPLNHEVRKAGADRTGFTTEHTLYTNHCYHKLFHQLDCHLLVISPESDPEIITRLDMLLIPGGPDINPAIYGQELHPETQYDPLRDVFEKKAIEIAIEKKIPLLGVCRGFQMINAALGGTLTQHLPEWSTDVQHRPEVGPQLHSHTVTMEGWLKGLFGNEMKVNSWHHQGIDILAPELEALAWSSEGLIEAYQSTDHLSPIFAVQWHPELLQDKESLLLVSRFLEQTLFNKKQSNLSYKGSWYF
ncbi:gamma-glutamyl-gamma-aminobutyrate hydrolase family protein [Niallia sp. XMNu-256]|uniref:gamma-glutamyl-gamma-aminobutyrate hydrolase family protein n=1 Tax=Niallia sp. XMNu-256 TaxID=3082444 RepID=UPI0030D4D221